MYDPELYQMAVDNGWERPSVHDALPESGWNNFWRKMAEQKKNASNGRHQTSVLSTRTPDQRIQELEARERELVAALQHYANEEEWYASKRDSPWRLLFNSSEVDGDGFMVAQLALKGVNP